MINIRTVRKVERYERFVRLYLRRAKKNWLGPEEVKAIKKRLGYSVNNSLRSEVEFYYFMKNKPQKYFLYIDYVKGIATTWTGQFLGRVFCGRPYTSNFGDTRINIDVIGANGVRYHGTYYKSAGDYARIKAYK